MSRRPRPTAADQRAAWMARFEDALVALKPELAGKLTLEWATADHLRRHKVSPVDAARRIAGLPPLPLHTCHYPGSDPATCPACIADDREIRLNLGKRGEL